MRAGWGCLGWDFTMGMVGGGWTGGVWCVGCGDGWVGRLGGLMEGWRRGGFLGGWRGEGGV